MSKEHVWPQWLKNGAEVEQTHRTHTSGFTRTGEHECTEQPNLVAERQRSVMTMRPREVCQRCNNGWMSALETRAEPLLEALWTPPTFGATSFDPAESATLARWAAKTAWVLDRINSPDFLVDAATRQQLCESVSPPPNTTVWVAAHRGVQNFQSYTARVIAGHRDDRWDSDRYRLVLLNSLTFRGLTLVVRWEDGEGTPPSALATQKWRQLWPRTEPMQWPPSSPISDQEALEAVTRLPGFRFDGEGSTFVNASDVWTSVSPRALFR